jgi:competence protein ComEA
MGRHRADLLDQAEPTPSWLAPRPESRRERLRAARARWLDRVGSRLPDRLRMARLSSVRRAVGGALVLALAVGGILGVRLAMASAAARPVAVRAAEPAPVTVSSADATSPTAVTVPTEGSASVAAGTTASGTRDAELLIQVAGRVHHPRVVRLPAGSRVQDAVRAAGGALPGSDLVGINLAQLLVDGQQVVVARAGHGSTVNGSGSGAGSSGSGTGAGAAGSTQVNLNTADVTGLDALPGVGPVLAQRILDWRTAHGRFTSLDELDEVSGIGDKLMAEIRPHARL